MNFNLGLSIQLLSATPDTLRSLLANLSDSWIQSSPPIQEGSQKGRLSSTQEKSGIRNPQSEIPNPVWTPFDVVGHLIHGEVTDWIPRARIILNRGEDITFVPFDRFAQFENSKGKSLTQLLDEFSTLRGENLDTLRSWNLTDAQLDLEGMHPELGRVTLRQLLATWVVHDLNHIRQIVTSMAKRYEGEVGVWREYLSILK